MYNWLRVFNTSENDSAVSLLVFNPEGVFESSLNLKSHTGLDFGLHETSTYGTVANSYGMFEIGGEGIISDLIRLRPSTKGGFDFVSITKVTPLEEASQ